MSSFNSFLGGVRAGQDAQQRRQSAFNASMMARDEAAIQPPANRQDSGGGSAQNLVQVFAGLDTAQRQRVKADLARKGQIVAALSSLPADQQAIGIQTYGKDFGIDDATLQRAAVNPGASLFNFSSSLREAEAMLEEAGSEMAPSRAARFEPSNAMNISQNEDSNDYGTTEALQQTNLDDTPARSRPVLQIDSNVPRDPRPAYPPLDPRPPYASYPPHPPGPSLGPRPPYPPLGSRPPYDPQPPHPPYPPMPPRPPYAPRTPEVPIVSAAKPRDVAAYPSVNTGPQRDTLLMNATTFQKPVATDAFETKNGLIELTLTSAGEPLTVPGKSLIDRFARKIPKDKTKKLVTTQREPTYLNGLNFTFQRYNRLDNGKLTLAKKDTVKGVVVDEVKGSILSLKPGEARTVAFELEPGIYRVTLRGGSGAPVYTQLNTVNFFSDGRELDEFFQKMNAKNVMFVK